MKKLIITFVALLVAMLPEARAADYRLTSSTYLRGFVRTGLTEESQHLPFYELVRLNARDLGVPGLTIQADLWGQIELRDVVEGEDRATGDVSVLLMEYKGPYKSNLEGLRLKLGRQFVSAGPSILEQLDGGLLDYRLPLGFSVTAFGGLPTGIRFTKQPWVVGNDDDTFGSSWVMGGRLGYQYQELVALGVSYRQKRFDGLMAFNELGGDAVISPLSWLELLGNGVAELTSQRLKEARAALRLYPLRRLSAGAGYRFVSPDLFIPRSSIFSVFTDETHQEGYVELDWSPRRWLSLQAEGQARMYPETCTRDDQCDAAETEFGAEGRAILRMGPNRQHRVTLEGERIGAPEGGYTRFRIAGAAPLFYRLSAIADVDVFLLDDAHDEQSGTDHGHDENLSFSGSAHLTWALRDDLILLAGGRAMVTPLFSKAGAFMVRLTWVLDAPKSTGPVQVTTSASSLAAMHKGGVR